MPFAIPEKWKWAHLSQAGSFVGGYTPKEAELSDKGEIPYFKVSDMNRPGNEQELVNTEKYLITKPKRVFLPGTIVYPKNGGAVFTNKRRLLKLESVIDLNTGGYVPGENLIPEYAFEFFKGLDFQKISKGTALPTIDQEKLRLTLIPIPPLLEQRRIVAKLNELLSLVETYGKEQEALEKMEKEFPDKLRASLLQEAIQGKLVPQLENEPEVAPIGEAPEDVPFAIPEKWKWISASYVQALVRGVTFPASAKAKTQTSNSICCLTTGSVQEKYANKADVFVDQSFMKNTRQILQMGDVVISSANSKELVGKSILWEDDSGMQKTFGGFLTVARVKDSQTMIPEYLFLVYRYMFKTGYFANLSTQTTNIANLSNKLLDSLVFPIPPLEEQRRIAAKLNELLVAVVQLENTISAT